MKKSESKKDVTKENNEKVNNKETKKTGFKSNLISKLVDKIKNRKNESKKDDHNLEDNNLKNKDAINMSDILEDINNMSDNDIKNICEDINNSKLTVGLDSKAIKFLSKNKDNEKVKELLKNLNQSMNIDINSISELSSKQLINVKSLCKIDKVYVNSGWDEAAKLGYSVDKYAKIRQNADKMLDKAISELPKDATEKQKFMAIYNVVLKAEHYDHSALDASNSNSKKFTSRNLEGFFLHGKSVCAGTADALKNLCECAGIEAEYVQGNARSKKESSSNYHAWVKVNIDGKWYNADPTWDANKAGKPYEYCLKSDKDFYGHSEDKSYNPTYQRGSNVSRFVNNQTREYRNSNTTMERSAIREYFDDSISAKKIVQEYAPTENDYRVANENKEPIANREVTIKKLTFKQKLAKFLSTRKFLGNISFIKKFISKNKLKDNKKDENSKNIETESEFVEKIPEKVANQYIKNSRENSEEKHTQIDKEHNLSR